jgi:hypothetical protein
MSKTGFKCTFKNVFALTFLYVLIGSPLIFPAAASSIGVQVGTWAKYSILFEYTSSAENLMPSNLTAVLREATETDWNNVTVKDIYSDSDITLEVTTHVKNGTSITDTYVVNILTGEGNITFPVLVVANLQQGDNIIDDPSAPVINKTITMNYAGANREVNFVPIIAGNVGWNIAQQRYVIDGNGSLRYFYFDKKTGFLCRFELLTKEVESSYDLSTHMNIVMMQTNLWVPETFSGWVWWLVGATIIIVPAILFYFSWTRKKKRRRVAPHLTKHR